MRRRRWDVSRPGGCGGRRGRAREPGAGGSGGPPGAGVGWYPGVVDEGVPMETELKVPVEDLGEVRRRLAGAGGELLQPTAREVNLLYDDPGGRIAGAGGALRLRRYGERWLLTLKGPPSYPGGVKTREELETEVGDGEVMGTILERLGFLPRVRYEKDRELWRLREAEVALDHTPMGEFVEIEGPAHRIPGLARRLGLDPAKALRGSYVTLWQAYRAAHPELELPEDMVFEG